MTEAAKAAKTAQQRELATLFDAERTRLRGVALRLLGSLDEADDAIQRTWLKLSREDTTGIRNLAGWLTTVLARECLDLLRARTRRAEFVLPDDPLAPTSPNPVEDDVVLIESVGRALLVVLDRLSPAERVALVLHDVFGMPFTDVAPVVARSPVAAKKLASRARQKIGGGAVTEPSSRRRLAEQRRLASAFVAAARHGDLAGLLVVLAPDVVRTADAAAVPEGVPLAISGIDAVARETAVLGGRAAAATLVLVDDTVGIVVAPGGRPRLALVLTFRDGRISAYDVVGDPARLAALRLRLLPA
ncbi:sigma-70 family RNA polymerase sigma factor [Saccharomonospora piscinae]|uniref:sigma-70 family RNA polymerase sigma factor n=1 Tax=Saccharomonospora piscinae TaxID=687388 RepID=UPI001105DD7D|nr:sigma-70 family RNA polymerase sigma factor [Saccharomonospora piscinae]TLW94453.1 sigma-70 family RNA polymerase sigma factor [Saccharomonospora piscinae]